MEKKEDKVPVLRTWRAKMSCVMPFGTYEAGETIKVADDQVTPRIKACFECLTPADERAAEEAKKIDPDVKVMLERLKAAKIPVKRGASTEDIKRLFNDFIAKTSTEMTGAAK